VSSANSLPKPVILSATSFIKIRKSNGPKTDPWGTPLEYASEVWDNCGQANCNRLEKIQIEAARIVTGLSIYASFDSIYKETGYIVTVT
jgi:hypothetical protein